MVFTTKAVWSVKTTIIIRPPPLAACTPTHPRRNCEKSFARRSLTSPLLGNIFVAGGNLRCPVHCPRYHQRALPEHHRARSGQERDYAVQVLRAYRRGTKHGVQISHPFHALVAAGTYRSEGAVDVLSLWRSSLPPTVPHCCRTPLLIVVTAQRAN